MDTEDFLIVGGGLAGLYSAYRLTRAGLSFRLVEGAERVGGRILAAPAPAAQPAVLDVGPAWFWPHQQRLRALLEELDVAWFPQFTEGDALFQTGKSADPVRTAGAGSMPAFRVSGGMTTLVAALLRHLDPDRVHRSAEVFDARRDGDRWTVSIRTDDAVRTFHSRALVAALPPRMLLRGLNPRNWASTELQDALGSQQTWMAAQAKFVAAYEKPFWRDDGLAGDAFSRVGPLLEIHDATDPESGVAALFGFVGLPASLRATMDAASLGDACLNQLVALFGEDARNTRYTYLKDWSREPLTTTHQDVAEAPAHASFPMHRFRTELESLDAHLAGSEYASREPGYLEGALEASDHWLRSLKIATLNATEADDPTPASAD